MFMFKNIITQIDIAAQIKFSTLVRMGLLVRWYVL